MVQNLSFLAIKLLQREGDTRRILLEWEVEQRRQKNEAAPGSPKLAPRRREMPRASSSCLDERF
jgi:hypothetical protein